jgi:hypothetical protein
MSDEPLWKSYTVRRADMFGYDDKVKYGVREEYPDGATRFVHNEVVDTREEADAMAARFNGLRRKGKTYDNTMKEWR